VTATGVIATARSLRAGDTGILAMDERTPTGDERFAVVGVPETVGVYGSTVSCS
jgi:hypothetical protein